MNGVYPGLSFAEYTALPGINWSTLSAANVSPKHYRWLLTHPRTDTASMSMGRAVHCAVLEPDDFPRRYVLWDAGARRGSDWQEFSAMHADKDILSESEYAECLAIRDAVRRHHDAKRLLRSGRSELSICWTDEQTGLKCKARLDRLTRAVSADLKTSRDIGLRRFAADAANLLYHGKMAFSTGGLATLGMQRTVEIIAVENHPPYDVGVFPLEDDELYAGEVLAGRLLHLVADCKKRRRWPGQYPNKQPLLLPGWAYPPSSESELS